MPDTQPDTGAPDSLAESPSGAPLGACKPGALEGRAQVLASAVTTSLLGIDRLGVAYSGGVDSATLLALAAQALGRDNVLGMLAVSPSLPGRERRIAHEVAGLIGVRIIEITTDEFDNPAYVANGPDRCFHCKAALFRAITDQCVRQYGLDAVAYGEIAANEGRFVKPGTFAATNYQVLRPLADAGLTKADVREIARSLGLPVADKPASPCLATRIPHGVEVTAQRLAQVERAEGVVRALGFGDCRVRHHGDIARVEVPAEQVARAVTEPTRSMLLDGVKGAGFAFVTIDLAGLQSGVLRVPLLDTQADTDTGGQGGTDAGTDRCSA